MRAPGIASPAARRESPAPSDRAALREPTLPPDRAALREPALPPEQPPLPAPPPLPEPTWPPLATPGPPLGLYVHVPFCVSRCPYCDFAVVAGAATRGPRNRIGAFLTALETELRLRADALDERFGPPGTPARPALETCYFGGGTPSLLGPAAVERILRSIADRFGLAPWAEVSLEANPGPDERGDPLAWRQVGITRLSFGGQSLDPAELRTLGRRHRPADVVAAIEAARRAGIGSVNIDLLYDIPGQTLASFAASLAAVIEAGADHVSCYALELGDGELDTAGTPDRSTVDAAMPDRSPPGRGALAWRRRMRVGQDPDRAAAMYELAAERLAAAGYGSYELSNWARPGHESRHNLLYWARRPVEAVGPGAHAFDGAVRRWATASLEAYLAALVPLDGRPPELPPGGREVLDPATARAETWILGLRTERGLPALAVEDAAAGEAVAWAMAAGLVEVTAGEPGTSDRRVRLTRRGRLLSNEVFVRFV